MSEMKPSTSSGRKFSAVWIIPLVALVIGLSMAVHNVMTQGPTITLDFETAEGLHKGKTKIRLLNVEIGLVEDVVLKEDMSGVTATVKLGPEARPLLHEDTRFWVVRPRIGAGGVSGLSTILAGTYIEMAPGTGAVGHREFVGLEEPPQTPLDAPGVRLTLYSRHIGSLSVGESVVYRGYNVGRIEAMEFDQARAQVRYEIFVDDPFHQLINSNTRFWNASGISLNASAEGFEVQMGSMDTLLLGGAAFGNPPDSPSGSPVESGQEYYLYESYDDSLKNPYTHGLYYVVSFFQSVRGLEPGAPVEYRGIPIGRVERILLKELSALGMADKGSVTGRAIPVLIYLEPGRMELPDSKESTDALKKTIEAGVTHGLRATLLVGNLLTGKQLVGIDYFPDEEPAELGMFEQYVVIPTIETGVGRLGNQVRSFMDRLNALPLEETVAGVNKVLGSVNGLLERDDTKKVSSELVATLGELRYALAGLSPDSKMYQSLGASVNSLNGTLENLDALIRKLSIKPSSLLFPGTPEMDPIPEARP
ncbi:MAG TPA: intermembrane transport protein PqiB [Porticoccus sp.]|nr:intermembrane transport protein PqiB [Porticoccus sp.]